jgi:hypothetical protein
MESIARAKIVVSGIAGHNDDQQSRERRAEE